MQRRGNCDSVGKHSKGKKNYRCKCVGKGTYVIALQNIIISKHSVTFRIFKMMSTSYLNDIAT